jgi:hypothetical protein
MSNLHFGGTYCYLLCSGFLLGIFFDPEDGSSMFLQIISWSSVNFSVFHSRRQKELFLHNESLMQN